MKLKQLRISGFKSFCDETEFCFDSGLVSMIVGPNGCGKSNVADALRWALGEQGMRFMRSPSMSDVIFNGSKSREAVNRAEVNVLFDNSERKALEKYNDFKEIVVTRRLYRSGESEYLINNISCRLMDVRELLMDTGAAGRAYSIVEQGRVETFISASPQERRQYMEEAAGVVRYKTHRLAAERKLEQTQQNLQRMDDLLDELYRQESILARQVKDAQHAQVLQTETEQVQLALKWRHYAEELGMVQSLKYQLDALNKESEGEGEAGVLETRLQAMQIENSMAAERLQASRIKREGLLQTLHQARQQLQALYEGQQQSKPWKTQIEKDLQLSSRRVSETKSALEKKEKSYAKQLKHFQSQDETLQCAKQVDTERQTRFACEEEEQQQSQERLFACHDYLDGLNRQNQRLAEQLNRWKGSEEILMNQHRELNKKKTTNETQLREQQEALTALQKTFQNGEMAYHAAAAEETSGIEAKSHAQTQQAKWEKQRLQCVLRHQALQEMQDNMEGHTASIKRFLTWLQTNTDRADTLGVLGLLSDMFTVPKEVLEWAGNYLAPFSEWVVIQHSDVLVELANLLEAEQIEGVTFICLDRLPAQFSVAKEVKEENLAEQLECESKLRPLFEALFGDVKVSKGGTWTDVFGKDWQKRLEVGSEWLCKSAAVHFGYKGEVVWGRRATAAIKVLDRRNRLAELEKQLASLQDSYQQISQSLEQAGKHLAGCVEKRIERQAGLEEHQQALRACEQHLYGMRFEQQKLQQQEEQLQSELDEARNGQKTLASERGNLATKIKEAEVQKAGLEKKISQLPKQVGRARQLLKEAAEILSREQSLHVRLQAQIDSEQKACQQLAKNLEQLSSQQAEQQSRQQQWDSEELKKREREQQLNQQIASLQKSYVSQQKETQHLEKQFQQQDTAQKKIEIQVKKARERQNKRNQNKHALELKFTEASVKLQQIVPHTESLLEKMQASVATEDKVLTDEKTTRTLPASDAWPQVLPKELSTLSFQQLERKLLKLENKLQKLPHVNMAALEEHQKLTERITHMKNQQADLQGAIQDLHTSIRRLNQQSRKRFLETFEAVNIQFQKLFVRIFGGGEARLILTQQDDALHTGVDIHAQPPGKKLQKLSLLSGGEKALTAIALIFSFFLHKPSPFCLLDEVDAPLDDANISRFNRLVQDMTAHTQLIIITHNKRTMEIGDTLYGVTMENAGISRIVSVQLPQQKIASSVS